MLYSYSDKNVQKLGWEEPPTVNFPIVSLALIFNMGVVFSKKNESEALVALILMEN